jgi:predicted lipoprotein with Yx(FWY)xxD motif
MYAPRGRMLSLLLLFVLLLAVVPVAFAQTYTLTVTKDATFGNILTDSQGRTLYHFTKDTVNASSACYARCATTWPPLLIADGNPVAGAGVDGNLLGVLTRTDGGRQVMFNGMPLYYYSTDSAPGDTKGQEVGKVWFIVKPNTTTVGNQGVSVHMTQNPALGPILVDSTGRTLYHFTRDSENHSVCYDQCANVWPPLLVGATDATLDGVGGTVGAAVRNDGNRQVTYDGMPLYYYATDANAGDTKGQGVGNVWFVVAPATAASAPAAPAPATSAPVPATLPRTGADDNLPLGALALLALLLAAVGTLVRSRYQVNRG